jgi:hypothetical protein
MNAARADGDELCERLLDSPTSELGGKPRRFAIDSKTWYKCGRADPALDLLPAVGRIVAGSSTQADYVLVLSLVKKAERLWNLSVEPDDLDLSTFDYDNQPGCLICIWDKGPLRREASLTCRGCGKVFDFAAGAGMVPVEAVMETFRSAGGKVTIPVSRVERPDPDLVSENVAREYRGVSPLVIAALKDGKYRRWTHEQCKRIQGYPGSFFLGG